MKYTVEKGERLDIFLTEKSGLTRSAVKNLIEDGQAVVNGTKRLKSGFELKTNDIVEFEIPAPKTLEIAPNDAIDVEIVYQDEDFAIINKPQGMVVHPATSYRENDTLVNVVLSKLDNLSSINGVIRPGIVHRLDKDTSGLIIIAKNDKAHKSLASQIEKKTARRIYYGLCDGNFKEDEGIVDAPIARNKKDRKKMAIDADGRRAVTHYKVIERFSKYTLVRFELETGRTHQIRVHASSLHHAIVGDAVYGGSQTLYKNGQLLHAKELVLTHPTTGAIMSFQCDLPDYFEEVLAKLRKTQNGKN